MKRLPERSAIYWIVLLMSALFLLACDIGGSVSKETGPSSEPTENRPAAPTRAASGGRATPIPPAAKDPSALISDSLNRVLMMDKKVLDSYHLEASGVRPGYDTSTKKVESQDFTLKADVSGDDIYLISTTKGAQGKTTEGYIMDSNSKDQTKGYVVKNGKLEEDLFLPLSWAMLPLDYGMPLIFAAMGPSPAGSESVDGRAADKFNVDVANAPAGAAGALKGMGIIVYSSKGTVWVDKETGALLKMAIDYEKDVQDSGKVVGKGSGHIDLAVTQVGKVSVKLPTGAAPVATTAPAEPKEPTPTAAPAATVAKVGQRVVKEGIALTVTKVQALDTFGGEAADEGFKWILATVTVENAGNVAVDVGERQFEYVDRDGVVAGDLFNAPSAPGDTGKTVFDHYTLRPGGKAAGKTLPIQIEQERVKGLTLLFTIDESNSISVDLGL